MKVPPTDSMNNKKILILGFGKEGQSTFKFLTKYIKNAAITIGDQNPEIKSQNNRPVEENVSFMLGEDYLNDLDRFDVVFKSPGIPYASLKNKVAPDKITSQTEFFLKIFRQQIVGITGTKGKSTTSSLVFSILKNAGKNALLVGNIGIPPLDLFEKVSPETIIVYEMSSHQLEDMHISPHIAVFLNIFEEHLDHYKTMEVYRSAKYNIFRHQKNGDYLILNKKTPELMNDATVLSPDSTKLIFSEDETDKSGTVQLGQSRIRLNYKNRSDFFDFSNRIGLPGEHNLKNIMAAVCVSGVLDIDHSSIQKSVDNFRGLEHRMEYVGEFQGIHFYNDSIATIPEATIEALKTLNNVNLLILGGMDRGVNYDQLVEYLSKGSVDKIVLTGQTGSRLKAMLQLCMDPERLVSIRTFKELPTLIKNHIPKGGVCLLSPAAASYGLFRNFEERGNIFKEMVKSL
jgi:UDP-N-acetylmuramoylalanine--D-glutamate ligase